MKNHEAQNHYYTINYQQIENEFTQNERKVLTVFISNKQDFTWYGFTVCFKKSEVEIYQYGCCVTRIHKNCFKLNSRMMNFLIKHFYIKAWQN
jgi:hypothetical protein